MPTAKSTIDLTLYRRLLRQARPYWLQIAGTLLLDLLSTPVILLSPLPLKIVVDSVIGSQPLPGFLDVLLPAATRGSDAAVLGLAVGLVVAIPLLGQLQGLGSSLLRSYTGEQMVLGFRARLLHHVQRVSLSYHDSRGTSDSTYRIQYDAPAIQWFTIDGVIPLCNTGFTLAGVIYVTLQLDWQLALVALTVSPILLLVTQLYSRRLRNQWLEYALFDSSAMSVVQEVLAAIRVVKAFGREDYEEDRFVRHSSKAVWSMIRVVITSNYVSFLVSLTIGIGTAAVLFMGVRHVQSGVLTLGELLLVNSYITQLFGPLKSIGDQVTNLQKSLASAERAFALLDEAPDITERKHARPIARASGAVAFRNVSFGFNEDHLVLRDISFQVTAGTRVGIVGRTGAGKTTLMSLLIRFFDPTSGQILLDGVDLRDYKLADLRNQFAIVLQEPVLFSTSIAENIAYARPSSSDRDIIAAAKAANAHTFIASLPQGYETQVGERGMRLSGGERQRISLARAFLKDAPILILDEPTSSVDTRTEAAIMDAMERLMHGRTTFMIAHRLSTLENCNVLLTIADGRLAAITSDVSTAIRNGLLLGGHTTQSHLRGES